MTPTENDYLALWNECVALRERADRLESKLAVISKPARIEQIARALMKANIPRPEARDILMVRFNINRRRAYYALNAALSSGQQ
jgi:hypothetical protein